MITKELESLICRSELVIWDGLQADVIKFCFDVLSGNSSVDSFSYQFNELIGKIKSFQPATKQLELERQALIRKVDCMSSGVDVLFDMVSNGPESLRLDDVKTEVKFYIGDIVVSSY